MQICVEGVACCAGDAYASQELDDNRRKELQLNAVAPHRHRRRQWHFKADHQESAAVIVSKDVGDETVENATGNNKNARGQDHIEGHVLAKEESEQYLGAPIPDEQPPEYEQLNGEVDVATNAIKQRQCKSKGQDRATAEVDTKRGKGKGKVIAADCYLEEYDDSDDVSVTSCDKHSVIPAPKYAFSPPLPAAHCNVVVIKPYRASQHVPFADKQGEDKILLKQNGNSGMDEFCKHFVLFSDFGA